jgi:hypothetical protein
MSSTDRRIIIPEIPWLRGGDRWPLILAYRKDQPIYRCTRPAPRSSSNSPATSVTGTVRTH